VKAPLDPVAAILAVEVKQAKALAARCAKYGITVEQYKAALARFGGRCWLCLKPPLTKVGKRRVLCIDHDHQTKVFRGIACFECNKLLMPRQMTVQLAARIALYLAGQL
jgi:hypothetical protein